MVQTDKVLELGKIKNLRFTKARKFHCLLCKCKAGLIACK